MELAQLGWNEGWEKTWVALALAEMIPGRVATEDKHAYVLLTAQGEFAAAVSGKLLHQTASNAELPKVGDWVAATILPGENKAIIHAVLPRRTRLARKVAGREVEEQLLAANIRRAFLVQALDQSFNRRQLERFLVMVREGGAQPVVVLNKADLCDDSQTYTAEATLAAGNAPIVLASAKTGCGVGQLRRLIPSGETAVFVGPSGVGKSSLINRLYGEEIQATLEVREHDAKGRHTTTWRELILLPGGGLVIDTPGMRECHIWMADEGLQEAFPDMEELAVRCHFRNCSHTVEKRCAVLEAVAGGQVSRERYENYLKLQDELSYLAEERKKHTYQARKQRTRAR